MIVSAFFAEDMSTFVTDVHILPPFAIATCWALLIISAHNALIFLLLLFRFIMKRNYIEMLFQTKLECLLISTL